MNTFWKIPLADIGLSKKEEQAVLGVLRSKWLTMGEVTQKFEDEFSQLHNVNHAVAVTNCTAGLHLAMLALGIKPGDEVICPALTFVATANAILYAGATPVFADITSPENLTISPNDILRKITPKTRAIVVVHYAGYPCDMGEIGKIAEKHGLFVIEDCAHAPLTRYRGKYLGAYGNIGVFSFFSNKNMTTGEGGMVVTGDQALARKIKSMRSHGMTTLTLDRHKGHAYTYDVVELGYNFRMDEMRAALGIVQLSKVGSFNRKRRALVKYYRNRFEQINSIDVPFKTFKLQESSCHIFPVLLRDGARRANLQEMLKSEGIQTSIHYPPIHQFSFYKRKSPGVTLPVTEEVATRVLTLPLYPGLTTDQIDFVVQQTGIFFKEL